MVATIVAYMPVLSAGFVWDDLVYIQDSRYFNEPTLNNVFRGLYPLTHSGGVYRPFRGLVYVLAHGLFGTNPTPYHMMGLGFHLVTSVLIAVIGRELTDSKEVGLVAGVVFGVHPIHVEAVAWATAGFDVLFAIFYLLAIYFHLRWRKSNENGVRLWGLVFLVLALLTNELALTIPILLLTYDWLVCGVKLKNREGWSEQIPGILLVVGYWLVRSSLMEPGLDYRFVYETFWERGVLAFVVLGTYIKNMIWPMEFSVDTVLFPGLSSLVEQNYFYFDRLPKPNFGHVEVWAPVLLSISWLVIGVVVAKYSRMMGWWMMWVVVTLIPVLQVVPLPIIYADRYAYLASVGVAWIFGSGYWWLSRSGKAGVGVVALVVLVGLLGAKTYARAMDWQSEVDLWGTTLEQNPQSAAAMSSLGVYYAREENYLKALDYFEKLRQLNPYALTNRDNIARIYRVTENYQLLLGYYELLIEAEPNNPQLWYLVGKIYEEDLSDSQKAEEYYEKALDLAPNDQGLKDALNRMN